MSCNCLRCGWPGTLFPDVIQCSVHGAVRQERRSVQLTRIGCCAQHWYCGSLLRQILETLVGVPEHRFCARDGYTNWTGPR